MENNFLNEKDVSDYLVNNKSIIRNFIEIHKDLIDIEPEEYKGERDLEAILYYLGSNDGIIAKINTPIETIIFNENNLYHLLMENNKERLLELPKIIETLKNPNLIIETAEAKVKHNYIKAFNTQDIVKTQLVVVKILDDGNFYVTTFRLKDSKFMDKLINGKIIYDLSDNNNNTNEAKINFKRAYLNSKDIKDWTIEESFGYFNSSKVSAENDDSILYWSQESSSIIYIDYTKNPQIYNLDALKYNIPKIGHIIQILAQIDLPINFPQNVFILAVKKVCKDIEINYPLYEFYYNKKNESVEKVEMPISELPNSQIIDTVVAISPTTSELINLCKRYRALRIMFAYEPHKDLQLIAMPAVSTDHRALALWLQNQGFIVEPNSFYHLVDLDDEIALTVDTVYRKETIADELKEKLAGLTEDQIICLYNLIELLPNNINCFYVLDAIRDR